MNIAPSPDPTPMPARGETSAASPPSAKDSAGIAFADLLGTPHETPPDGTPISCAPKAGPSLPRKQPMDGTDPALAVMLPFMLPQVPQTLPAPLPPGTGAGRQITGGDSAVVPQPGSDAPFSAQSGVPTGVMTAVSFALGKSDSVPAVVAAAAISPEVSSGSAAGTPAPIMQPAQAGLPAVDAPAEISPLVAQIASPSALPPTAAVPENRAGQRQPQQISDAANAGEADGTPVAMQHRTMREQFSERQSKTKASAASVPSAPEDSRADAVPETGQHSAEVRAITSLPAAPATAGITFGPQAGRGEGADAPSATDSKAAVQITQQTIDLTEHVRVTGRDHVEVQMRLNDGQEVTVSLRLEHGEWKPVFKTDTVALCRALEQNWHRAAAQPSVHAVKFGTPVFESQRTQADAGQNPQQQSGGRERPSSRREQESAFGIPTPPALTPAKPARSAPTTAVQLYA